MADTDKRKPKPKGRSVRTTALTGLLAVVAIVAIWLSDCIPGFGLGGGTQEGEGEQAEQEPAKQAEPEKQAEVAPARKPMPMKLTVDVRGCSIDGAEPIDCKALCEDPKRFEGRDSVIVDAKDGPHALVTDALDCIKAQGLAVAINRE